MVRAAGYRPLMTLKRYLLFAGSQYYPSGGWDDLKGSFDTLEEAVAAGDHVDDLSIRDHDWFQVVDSMTGEIVSGFSSYTRETRGSYVAPVSD